MIPETALALSHALRWLLARLQAKRPAQGILGARRGYFKESLPVQQAPRRTACEELSQKTENKQGYTTGRAKLTAEQRAEGQRLATSGSRELNC